MRKHTRPRTRTEPSARWVASVTASGSAGRAVRSAGGPTRASDPHVVCALWYGCKSGADHRQSAPWSRTACWTMLRLIRPAPCLPARPLPERGAAL